MRTDRIKSKNLKKVFFGLLCFIILAIVLWPKTTIESGVKNGYIITHDTSSDIVDSLFYLDNKNNLYVNLTKLDGCTNADVLRSQGIYIISTIKNQITILPEEDAYYFNANKITEDFSYLKPVYVNGYPYADFKTIFKTLGYDSSFESNYDNTIIAATLIESETFKKSDYSKIEATIKQKVTIPETISQIEVPIVDETDRETTELPIIPEPTEVDKSQWPVENTEPFISSSEPLESNENYSEEPIEEKVTEETYKEEIWNSKKEELTNIFENSQSNFGQKPFATIGDNGICFNQAAGGTYGNSVTVLNNTSDGYFMIVMLSADWSDQAASVVTPQSKAYYNEIEEVYKKTLITTLGGKEGSEFFEYLKKHADEMQDGGYISQYNEKGVIKSIWTDEKVGDGVKASTLELSQWTHRYTDDGLEYDIVRNGDGIKIIIF